MQPAIMIEQVYSRHNYTNYPDAYYDMCNGKAEFPKCSGLVKKPVYCGISYGHPSLFLLQENYNTNAQNNQSKIILKIKNT